jgi:hypothetical protein
VPTAYLSPSQLKELTDVSVNPGSGENNYPLTWNNTNGRWQASNNMAGVTVQKGVGANTQAIGSVCNSSGSDWIAQGFNAAELNTSGSHFLAQGLNAARANTVGFNFLAQGPNAAAANTTAYNFLAQGPTSAFRQTTGLEWIAQGPSAARENTTGGAFIAQGTNAGFNNLAGNFWIAQGTGAAIGNTSGKQFVVQGSFAADNNLVGESFVAQGYTAGRFNTGSYWVAQGYEAGYFDTRSNSLNIANSQNKSLICGLFDTDCIYFGHVGPITSSASVPVPTAAVHAAASNTTRASLRINAGIAPTTPNTGDIWVNSSNNSLNFQIPLVNLQGTQVLATRRTGWAAPTGTATRTSFDTATATTTQLAERLKALIDDLTTHGLIGT